MIDHKALRANLIRLRVRSFDVLETEDQEPVAAHIVKRFATNHGWLAFVLEFEHGEPEREGYIEDPGRRSKRLASRIDKVLERLLLERGPLLRKWHFPLVIQLKGHRYLHCDVWNALYPMGDGGEVWSIAKGVSETDGTVES